MASMMVSIDPAGRIVVPKDIRQRLGLIANTEFELTVEGEELRLTPRHRRRRVVMSDDGWPVIEADGDVTTDADVQRWRDADQR